MRADATLDQLIDATNEASRKARAAWITMLLVFVYLAIIVFATTHKDLFLNAPQPLPFLGVELPLFTIYIVGPMAVLLLHLNLLVTLNALGEKVQAVEAALVDSDRGRSRQPRRLWQARHRRRLDTFVVTRVRLDEPMGVGRAFAMVTAWVTVTALPVLLLLGFQLRFLPYHDEAMSLWHRIAVAVDLVLLVVLGGALVWRQRWLRWSWRGVQTPLAGGVVVMAALVLTVPHDPDGPPDDPTTQNIDESQQDRVTWEAWLHDVPWVGLLSDSLRARLCRSDQTVFLPLPCARNLDLRLQQVIPLDAFETFDTVADSERFGDIAERYAPIDSLRGRDFRDANLSGLVLPHVDLITADLAGADLRGANVAGADLRYADLADADLLYANLADADLLYANLADADLRNANLADADLRNADLAGAGLFRTDLTNADLRGVNFAGTDLQNVDLARHDLSGVNFAGANLQNIDLSETSLLHINFSDSNLTRANLANADLQGANLADANLTNADLTGANLQRADLAGALLSYADLTGANLQRADLTGTTLWHANLVGADLGSYLISADLRHADLTGADLQHADLISADLKHADLAGADLQHADLISADLKHADLAGADLQHADLAGADLRDADFAGADLMNTNLLGANLRWRDATGATLRRAAIWGALPPENADNISATDLTSLVFQRAYAGLLWARELQPLTEGYLVERRADVVEYLGSLDEVRRATILDRLDRRVFALSDADVEARADALRELLDDHQPPSEDVLQEARSEVATRLVDRVCADDRAVLVDAIFNAGVWDLSSSAIRATAAERLLNDPACTGAADMSDDTRERLQRWLQ